MGNLRYVNIEMWKDAWFRQLSPLNKLVWKYLCDMCSIAGIWHVDLGTMEHFIRGNTILPEPFDEKKIVREINKGKERIRQIDPEHWYLPDYISFQWRTESLHISTNKIHRSIWQELQRYNIEFPIVVAMENNPAEHHWNEGKALKWLPKKKMFIHTEDAIEFWKATYPKVDIDAEMQRMTIWMDGKKEKAKELEEAFPTDKMVWHNFCARWILRAANSKKGKKKGQSEAMDERTLAKEDQEADEANRAYAEYMKNKKKEGSV